MYIKVEMILPILVLVISAIPTIIVSLTDELDFSIHTLTITTYDLCVAYSFCVTVIMLLLMICGGMEALHAVVVGEA